MCVFILLLLMILPSYCTQCGYIYLKSQGPCRVTHRRTVWTKHADPDHIPERVYEDIISSDWYRTAYQSASIVHDQLNERRHVPDSERLGFTVIAIGLESG